MTGRRGRRTTRLALKCLCSVLWRKAGTQLGDTIHYPALPHVGSSRRFLCAPLSLLSPSPLFYVGNKNLTAQAGVIRFNISLLPVQDRLLIFLCLLAQVQPSERGVGLSSVFFFFLRSAGKFAMSPHPSSDRARAPQHLAPWWPISPPSFPPLKGGDMGTMRQVRSTACARLCRSSGVRSEARLTLCCASSGRDLRTCSCSRYSATEGSLARTYMLSVNLSVTATRKTTEL